jgi:hypothetical protein
VAPGLSVAAGGQLIVVAADGQAVYGRSLNWPSIIGNW